jgi:hypothetical protein
MSIEALQGRESTRSALDAVTATSGQTFPPGQKPHPQTPQLCFRFDEARCKGSGIGTALAWVIWSEGDTVTHPHCDPNNPLLNTQAVKKKAMSTGECLMPEDRHRPHLTRPPPQMPKLAAT